MALPTGPDLAPPAIRADSLYRFFRTAEEETLALQGVSMTVAEGAFVAVTGPSGSGKSTLLACLAGLDEPDGGTVSVVGRRLNHRCEADRARMRVRHIGVLYQHSNLVDHLTVAQNVQLVRRLAAGTPPRGDTGALLDRVGLAHRADALPGHLSGGEAARAGLAVALANQPDVVLADEPTGELDSTTERQVLDLLRAEAAPGRAVVVAGHAPAVWDAADQVLRLDDGRVVS